MYAKKRVIFCTYPSLYSSLVLKKLLSADDLEVVAIINSTRVLNKKYGALRAAFKQIQLSGWRYSTYLFLVTDLFSLQSLVLSTIFKNKRLKTVSAYAKLNNIPVIDTPDINSQDVVNFIFSQQTDFLLAAHFNQLVKAPIISSLDLTCVNIHPSLLPGYKGVDPVFYALLGDEKRIGVSLHEMAEEFDTGNIISSKEISSNIAGDVFSNNCRLFEAGAELAIQNIRNENVSTRQVQNGGNYDSWPDNKQVRQLRKKNNKLINLHEYLKRIIA